MKLFQRKTEEQVSKRPQSSGQAPFRRSTSLEAGKTPVVAAGNKSANTSRRRLPVSRSKSFDDGKESANNSRMLRRSASKRRGSSRKLLADQDIDEIYDFVKQMKETNLGGSLLEEFVVKQTKDLEDANEEQTAFPIKSIQISADNRNGGATASA